MEVGSAADDAPRKQEDLFLPDSLVRLVLKICKLCEISKFNTFSILETINATLFTVYNEFWKEDDPKSVLYMCQIVLNTIRISEKFHQSLYNFSMRVSEIFEALGIKKEEYNKAETYVYVKLMKFDIKNPDLLEEIYYFITEFEASSLKDLVYANAISVLSVFYCWKSRIYEILLKQSGSHQKAMEVIGNRRLAAASIIVTALKLLNVSQFDSLFDKICKNLEKDVPSISAADVNSFSAVLFGLIKANGS